MDQMSGMPLERTWYDRSAVSVGAVHIGYGMFHRAHQAVYFDDYMEISGDLDWGIAAVNLIDRDSEAFAGASRADQGYLLKSTNPDGQHSYRLVRPHVEFADWASDRATAERLLSRPGVSAVTMTVTESGYSLGEDGSLDLSEAAVCAEIAGGSPRTVFAYLTRALERRATDIDAPITVMCCDNVHANGRMLESGLMRYLEAVGRQDLADWIRSRVSFPCSMVDRITPRVSGALANEAAMLFPEFAACPVQSEAFSQWVLEDRFAGPMPDLRLSGVEIVRDVNPYEEAKLRILNGGHMALAYLGALAGHQTFDQVMRDSELRAHFEAWEREEVLPSLTTVLPFCKEGYLSTVADRFGNAVIADSLERICMDGWSKVRIYLLPTLAACLRQGRLPRHGIRSVAGWYVFARRNADGTARIAYSDPCWEQLKPLLPRGREAAFAAESQLWGNLPDEFPEFVREMAAQIGKVEEQWPV